MMRKLLLLSFLANVGLSFALLFVQPARVAVHFGPDGLPNHWGSNQTNTLAVLGIQILLFCVFYLAPLLVRHGPTQWINLPHKEYWLLPANRDLAARKLAAHFASFGTAVFLLLLVAGLLALQANRAQPVQFDTHVSRVALALFAGYVAYWMVGFFRAFRPE